jgi:hypothetical protein
MPGLSQTKTRRRILHIPHLKRSRVQTRTFSKILDLIQRLPRNEETDREELKTILEKNPKMYPIVKHDALNKGWNIVAVSSEYESPTALTHRKTHKKHLTFIIKPIQTNIRKTQRNRSSTKSEILSQPEAKPPVDMSKIREMMARDNKTIL